MDIAKIWQFDLRRGNSDNPRNGACLLDAVSWFEYGRLGDHPDCVCPVIAAFARPVNDALPDDSRHRLKVFLGRLAGTVDPGAEQERAEYLAWQAIRVFAPLALDAAGFSLYAARLRMFEGSLADAAVVAKTVADHVTVVASTPDGYAASSAAATAAYAAHTAHVAATAHAATHAAHAAKIATKDGVYAGATAASAANAARIVAANANAVDAIIAALDGVLRIGRQAEPVEPEMWQAAAAKFTAARELV